MAKTNNSKSTKDLIARLDNFNLEDLNLKKLELEEWDGFDIDNFGFCYASESFLNKTKGRKKLQINRNLSDFSCDRFSNSIGNEVGINKNCNLLKKARISFQI
jgi:hypothetical protein